MRQKTQLTNRHIQDVLPSVLRQIEMRKDERPDLVLAGWNEVIAEKWRPMTEAISFEKGTIVVKVKNTTLYSILVQQEKPNLLQKLKKKFPDADIKNIVFRIG